MLTLTPYLSAAPKSTVSKDAPISSPVTKTTPSTTTKEVSILSAESLADPNEMTVVQMGLIVSATSWAFPTRAIRSQVLSMRQRPFVMMAQLSGMSGPEIILKELMPNLLPYLVMSLANSVYGGVVGSLGLQGLGIGDRRQPYLGMTIFWLNYRRI